MASVSPELSSSDIARIFTTRAETIASIEADKRESSEGAWNLLAQEIEAISSQVPADCLYNAALNLLNSNDGYQINIGLGLIATEPVIVSSLTNPLQLSEILDIIKPQCLTPKDKPEGPDLYNLIWAVEILLQLRSHCDQDTAETIQAVYNQIPQQNLNQIRQNASASDLKGTLVQENFISNPVK